jgi:hypothetical protein
MEGDWKTCTDLVTGLDIWALVPEDDASAQIAGCMTSQIKLECLRTYPLCFICRAI